MYASLFLTTKETSSIPSKAVTERDQQGRTEPESVGVNRKDIVAGTQ